MNKSLIANFRITDRAVPFVLLVAVFVSFGLLIPWLGFYWDDWPVIFMSHTQGSGGFWEFYQYDRPFSAWTYIVFAPILGDRPLTWHVFTLGLRWVTALLIWASLRVIWPRQARQIFWVSLLFAVCPVFVLQYVSVAYSQHWICYLLYFASIYLMLKSQEANRSAILWILPSAFFSILQMLTMEYFLGLELLRPVILWLYFRERFPDLKNSVVLKRVLQTVWVYVSLLAVYVIWRVFFLQLVDGDPNQLVFPALFLKSPISALIGLVQMTLQDLLYLLTAWISTITPANFELQRPFSLAVLAVVAIFGIFTWFALDRYSSSGAEQEKSRWHVSAIALGLCAILLGMLPVWMIGRQASAGALGNRFSLAALFGICVMIVGLLEWLSPLVKAKTGVICVLIVLAIHTNLFQAKEFQTGWEKQSNFYWQLYWRAPYIQPGTAFIAEGEIFPFVGTYSTAMGISLLYPSVANPQHVPYWFFSYWRGMYHNPVAVLQGTMLEDRLRNYSFQGASLDSLIIYFVPENNTCLRVLSMRDANDSSIPDSMRELLGVSNLGRIERTPVAGHVPPKQIFGLEPEHNWCYFYQKAELAYQYEDWAGVIQFMAEAKAMGLQPADMQEFLPLLDAYLLTGDFESALAHSLLMKRFSNKLDDRICTAWLNEKIQKTEADYISSFDEVLKKTSCFD